MRISIITLFLLWSQAAVAQWQPVSWPGIDTSLARLWEITCLKQINGRFYACTANGLFRSEDGSKWTRVDGIPPYFRPYQLNESDAGIFLSGANTATGTPAHGYENPDKLGYQWQPSALMPFPGAETNSLVKIGGAYFAIGFVSGINTLERSTNGGQNWTPVLPLSGADLISRFSWQHDTLYINFQQDRRLYRSTDLGETFQPISTEPMRGFQITDGLCVGQLLTTGPALTDTLLVSFDRGQTWLKHKTGLPDNENYFLFKYGSQVYLKVGGAPDLYAYDFGPGVVTDTFFYSAPYNLYDQNYQFGGIANGCFVGFNNDAVYQSCYDGPVQWKSAPGDSTRFAELYTWQDSLFLVGSKSGVNTGYLRTGPDQTPVALAPVEHLAVYSQTGHTYYHDTLYSISADAGRLVKYHVPSQTRTEELVGGGSTLDEVYRSRHHLAVKDYDVVYYRPLEGGPWESAHVINLSFAANADYLYYFSAETGWLTRIGSSGVPDTLPIADIQQWPVNEKPQLFAHDSVLFITTHPYTDPFHLDRLYLSTDAGNTFQTIDLPLGGSEPFKAIQFVAGKICVLQESAGVSVYDPATDIWSPYNDGLYEIPSHMVAFQDNLLVSCPRSGLFTRPLQPTYQARGRVFLDANANGLWDAGEEPMPNIRVQADLAGGVSFTTADGEYRSATDFPVDTHRVVRPHPLVLSAPPLTVTSNADTVQDFALQFSGNQRDVSVSLFAGGRFRPGFETPVYLRIDNQLLPATDLTLSLVFPGQYLSLTKAQPAPVFVSPAGDSLVWKMDSMGLFSNLSFALQFRTDDTTPLGKIIRLRAAAQSAEPDANIVDNTALLENAVVGSYDPNDKLVNRPNIAIQAPPVTETLVYTIRFQNTGTVPTEFVTLLDTLDAQQLDLSSYRTVSSSHPFRARLLEGNILKVRFDSLSLAPQQISETESQGYFSFSIRTKYPLQAPAQLDNRAGIYFDFNPVVLTPYATTLVDFTTATHTGSLLAGIRIYPNPAAAAIQIEHAGIPLTACIFDANGRLLLESELPPGESHLPLDNLPRGVLLIRLEHETGVFWGKVIRE